MLSDETRIVDHITDMRNVVHFMSVALTLGGDKEYSEVPHSEPVEECRARTCQDTKEILETLEEIFDKAWRYDEVCE